MVVVGRIGTDFATRASVSAHSGIPMCVSLIGDGVRLARMTETRMRYRVRAGAQRAA
jgi:hypothetical protein